VESVDGDDLGEAGEYVVDNEDVGFEITTAIKENWLRRTLLGLFGLDDTGERYVGMRPWDLPSSWRVTTDQSFYGTFVRSGHFKKSGEGKSKVAWTADLGEAGDYDVYYYFEGSSGMSGHFRRNRNRPQEQGKRFFLIYHDDGVDDLVLELDVAEEGWNYLGTYRFSAGDNRIELADKNEIGPVTADAVKWVKR